MKDVEQFIRGVRQTGILKSMPRQGWKQTAGVGAPESVAAHVFRTTLLAQVLAPSSHTDFDTEKCIKLALVHDLGETEVGDLTPRDTRNNKESKELEVVTELGRALNANEFEPLAREFFAQETREAQFVRELDKLEMAFQALDYEEEYPHRKESFDEFWEDAAAHIRSSTVRRVFDALLARREQLSMEDT